MNSKLSTENKFLLFVLFLVFIGYAWLVWSPIEDLLVHFIVDDAFYYFKTASNIAKGLGPTFDGEHLTNGYHPLWMGLSVLIYNFIPNDKGEVRWQFTCGDHGNQTEQNKLFRFNATRQAYILVSSSEKICR